MNSPCRRLRAIDYAVPKSIEPFAIDVVDYESLLTSIRDSQPEVLKLCGFRFSFAELFLSCMRLYVINHVGTSLGGWYLQHDHKMTGASEYLRVRCLHYLSTARSAKESKRLKNIYLLGRRSSH